MAIMFNRKDDARRTAMAEAWTVHAAAKDFRDYATADAALRIIDAHLETRAPRDADLETINRYFR